MNKLILSQLEQHLYAAAIFYTASWTPPNSKHIFLACPSSNAARTPSMIGTNASLKRTLSVCRAQKVAGGERGEVLEEYGGFYE